MKKARIPILIIGAAALLLIVGWAAFGNTVSVNAIFNNKTNEQSKEEVKAEDQALIKLGEENPAPVPADPEAAGPVRDPADFSWETGIFRDAEFPTSMGVSFQNRWQGKVDGWFVTVYAGSRADASSQGILLVELKDPDTWGNKFEGPYEAPIAGPLRIEDFKGSVLTVSGKGGDTVTFDVVTRKFS